LSFGVGSVTWVGVSPAVVIANGFCDFAVVIVSLLCFGVSGGGGEELMRVLAMALLRYRIL
jgi:hypothetical protein